VVIIVKRAYNLCICESPPAEREAPESSTWGSRFHRPVNRYIYVRTKYAVRLRILATSWATAIGGILTGGAPVLRCRERQGTSHEDPDPLNHMWCTTDKYTAMLRLLGAKQQKQRGRIKRGCSRKPDLQIGGKTGPRNIQDTGMFYPEKHKHYNHRGFGGINRPCRYDPVWYNPVFAVPRPTTSRATSWRGWRGSR